MAHVAWSCLDWQRYILLPLFAFPDLGRLACVSRDMRQLVQQSSSASSFVHHQRGARLYAKLDLAAILRHSRMPPSFVEDELRSWAFYNYVAFKGKERVEQDLQGAFSVAFARGLPFAADEGGRRQLIHRHCVFSFDLTMAMHNAAESNDWLSSHFLSQAVEYAAQVYDGEARLRAGMPPPTCRDCHP